MTTYNGVLCPELVQQFWNLTATSPAAPVGSVNYVLYTYLAGTTTPTPTYTDASLGVIGGPNSNPIVLNSAGQANIWLNPAIGYKFVYTTSTDTNPPTSPIYTQDNVYPPISVISLTGTIVGEALYPEITAETNAGITPTYYQYPPFDIRRYGGDPTNTSDSTAAFDALFGVLIANTGGTGFIYPGEYKISSSIADTLIPTTGGGTTALGIKILGNNAVINYSGSGYCFDFTAQATSALYAMPWLAWYGVNIELTSSASGGFRQSDMCSCRYYDCFVYGGSAAAGFTVRNFAAFSENNHFFGCGVINCQNGWHFAFTSGAQASMARTQLDGCFGAGITNAWIVIDAGCSVYDSRFTHFSGNSGSLYFCEIGSALADADMTATVFDGLDYEVDSTQSGQGIFCLNFYPNTSTVARRPVVYNVGTFATDSGAISLWSSAGGVAIAGPETVQTQGLSVQSGPLVSTWGQSEAYEANYGAAATRNITTSNSVLQTGVSLTGYASGPTGRVTFNRAGNMAGLRVFDALTGTSNANTLTLTTIPAEYRPAATTVVSCVVEDAGIGNIPALASISTAGVITFSIVASPYTFSSTTVPSATAFTTSGTKGLPSGTTIVWPL